MPQERIVLAEDEDVIRELCARTLSRAGYETVAVANGAEAVERARQEPFDLLITDIRMPRMSGLEAYRAIRDINPHLVAVVITGYSTLDVAMEAMRLGVYDFLAKPFTSSDLLAIVERALSRRRLEAENARLKVLLPLFDLSRAMADAEELSTVPERAVCIARDELRADVASLWLMDDEGHLSPYRCDGAGSQPIAPASLPKDLLEPLLTGREPVLWSAKASTAPAITAFYGAEKVSSAVSVPLTNRDRVLGVLNVALTDSGSSFSMADVEFLTILANQASIAMENARLLRETQEAYERLTELDHLKSELISIASHELRTPLAVILAYAAVLETEATGATQEHLGQVVQAAMQLKSIIGEMVSLRRIDTREVQTDIADVELGQIVESVLLDLEALARSKNHRVETDLPADLPLVRADAQALHLVISSLISNAFKFTPREGVIAISACAPDEQVVLAIRDTGIGIAPEEQERVFQRFYQVEASLRRTHGGIGLGLAIAREMADLMDGRIWVESTVSEGSTFYLALPWADRR